MTTYKRHPFSNAFRLFDADEMDRLVTDLKKKAGLREPILLFDDQVLDGWNRYQGCLKAGVKPRFEEFEGDIEDAFAYVESKSVRRNETPAERARAIVNLQKARKELGQKPMTQQAAAEVAGVSRSTITRTVRKEREVLGPETWPDEELKEDGELANAFASIDAIFGKEDKESIRLGGLNYKKKDVLLLGKICRDQSEKAHEMRDLVMGEHWVPERCLRFLASMPDDDSTVSDLKHYCLASKSKVFTGDFHGFEITIRLKRAIPR